MLCLLIKAELCDWLLGVDEPVAERTISPLEFVPVGPIKSVLEEIDIPEGSAAAGKQIVKLGFPRGALIVLIYRGNEFIIPSGGVILEAGDKLLVLADRKSLAESRAIAESKAESKQLSARNME